MYTVRIGTLPSGKSSNIATCLTFPAYAAKCSGVLPSRSTLSFSAPNLTSRESASPPMSAAEWHADTSPMRHVALGLAPAFRSLKGK